ncbi:MAG TPA: serine/threonine-protein kinase [Alphaproteobacteria bacterium]|nr:serine/threonine-protein kinase [Alphaproteobacteria bacterium]
MAIEHRSALTPGYRLHEYQIESVLGHGGFGITYLATDTHLHKKVAIKEFLPNDVAVRVDGSTVEAKSSSDVDTFQWGLERFTQEAQTLARFRHPNVIQISRYFEANGTAYFVMDYEDGESLKEILQTADTLPQSEIEEMLHPLLHALDAVHHAGVLHRDIKPGNIYIRADGTPVLLDFGAARQALGEKSQSLTSIFTAGYAPYEQYYSGGNQGVWTDIYALSAVLYRCATGKAPPEAPARVLEDTIVPASVAARGKYDDAFLAAIDAGLGVRAEERPADINTWRAMFGGAAAQDAQTKPGIVQQATPTARRPMGAKRGGKRGSKRAGPAGTGMSPALKWSIMGGSGALVAAGVVAAVLLIPGDGPTGSGGTTTASTGIGGPVSNVADPPRHQCDDLAADPWDPAKKGQGVPLGGIDGRTAAICKAAAERYPRAPRMMVQYARAMFRGNRPSEGVRWARRAAEAGSASGAFHLGVAYRHGHGIAPSDSEARRWFKSGADKNHALALYELATLDINAVAGPRDYTSGANRMRQAAERGVVKAQWQMGRLYLNGWGVAKDYVLAASWYRRAAERGHQEAQADIAYAYLNGRGTAKNARIAADWYRKAARQGNARAYFELGRMYEFGLGAQKNLVAARAFYARSANKGHAGAQNNLGTLYYHGKGVARDYGQAVRWFRRAADRGSTTAMHWMGLCYLEGYGLAKNNEEAYFWLALSVSKGDNRALTRRNRASAALSAGRRAAIDQRVSRWRVRR